MGRVNRNQPLPVLAVHADCAETDKRRPMLSILSTEGHSARGLASIALQVAVALTCVPIAFGPPIGLLGSGELVLASALAVQESLPEESHSSEDSPAESAETTQSLFSACQLPNTRVSAFKRKRSGCSCVGNLRSAGAGPFQVHGASCGCGLRCHHNGCGAYLRC